MNSLTKAANLAAGAIQEDFKSLILPQYRKDKYGDKMKRQILTRMGEFSTEVCKAINQGSVEAAERKYKGYIPKPEPTFGKRLKFLFLGRL